MTKPCKTASLFLLALALSGCAAISKLLDPGPVEEPPLPGKAAIDAAIEQMKPEPPQPPERVRSSLLPPLPGPDSASAEPEPRFDVSVSNAPAREFFMSLVEGTPYNVVVHPDVSGTISLQLKSVTIPEVMDAVQEVYGYLYRRAAGVFHVMAPRLQTQIFEVDYLNIRRRGQSQTRVSSGQVSEREKSNGFRVDTPTTTRREEKGMVSGSVIATDSESDLWREVSSTLVHLIGGGEGRSVVTSPNSGIVVIRAMPGELRDAERYLTSLEQNLQRQVILEAKIIEVTLDDGFRSGINWSVLQDGDHHNIVGSQIGGGTLLGPEGVSEIAGNTGVLDPGAAVPGLPEGSATSAFGGAFTAALEFADFTAFIELLETQGETHILSSPRVSTLNNQKAVIKVGSDEFFVTDISTTTVTGASTTTTPDIELTPFFSGIALDVTPQIDRDGYITLHIHPSVSEVRDQTKTISVGGDTQSVPLALSTIRETDSVIRARSGQIVVIGGLMQDNVENLRASTPFVSKIPFVSSLFEHNLETALKKELVILLRPVLVGQNTWRRALQDSGQRLEEMKRRQSRAGSP